MTRRPRAGDFDLKALYAALDARRETLGVSWAQVARGVNVGGLPVGRIASSTIRTLRTKRLAEADGVLQMLRWIERTPESFVSGFVPVAGIAYDLPATSRGVLRFDTKKLHAHLSERRRAVGLTWKQLEAKTGVAASHMTGLARGGRTAFPMVMRLTGWLGTSAASFVRVSPY